LPQTAAPTQESGVPASDLPTAAGKLHGFGISSILYHGSKNIYFDPVLLDGAVPAADIILISHAHDDHVEMASLKKIITSETVLIISPNAAGFYDTHREEIGIPAVILNEGELTEVGAVTIQAVPAFDMQYHARGTGGWVL
jgi:L-ascorbate metabolism protein UlaG (beta-lactamase superfamily)